MHTLQSVAIQHYVIKFLRELRQVDGFLRILRFPPPIKTERHANTEILFEMALNTIALTLYFTLYILL
jgi:hypothetical protein